MRVTVFDLEADAIGIEAVTTIHCLALVTADGEERSFVGPDVKAGVDLLHNAEVVAGHNVVEYDIPVIQKFYPGFVPPRTLDTLCGSRVTYAGNRLYQLDDKAWERGQLREDFPRKAPHSLEAWGMRLGEAKGGYTGDFKDFTPAMLAYCEQDVRVTKRLLAYLCERTPESVIELETKVAALLRRQRLYGVRFDEPAAVAMMAELVDERAKLTAKLRRVFPAWWAPKGKVATPKRDNAKQGRAAGASYQMMQLVDFNPSSKQHVYRCLSKRYGWKPKAFTPSGLPKTDEKILADLPYPEAPLLVRHKQVDKILGMLHEGDNAWLKLVRDGRIHGRVRHIGTITHRMAHSDPNLGNVPTRSDLGARCRTLFVASPGKLFVGVDASGLQLRMLAHYLAKYDDGRFAIAVLDDPHEYMREGTGLFLRDNQKTWTYATLFGAQDYKLGTIVLKDMADARERGLYDGKVPGLRQAARLGRASKARLEDYITGLSLLNQNLRKAAHRGWLRSLDGRKIQVLSQHRALNVLLMGGEAVVMKHALLRADADLQAEGLRPGVDYEFVLNVHDEWQVETDDNHKDVVAERLTSAVRAAGLELGVRCQLAAKAKFGGSWAETH